MIFLAFLLVGRHGSSSLVELPHSMLGSNFYHLVWRMFLQPFSFRIVSLCIEVPSS